MPKQLAPPRGGASCFCYAAAIEALTENAEHFLSEAEQAAKAGIAASMAEENVPAATAEIETDGNDVSAALLAGVK